MTPCRIGVLVGSIRKESINAKLAVALQRFAPPGFSFHRIRIDDLPLYNHDTDPLPQSVQRLYRHRGAVKCSDARCLRTRIGDLLGVGCLLGLQDGIDAFRWHDLRALKTENER